MNFGNKLLVVFGLFATLMGYMVYRCMGVRTELVSKEYYKDEIAYQHIIDGENNANALAAPPKWERSGNGYVLNMPASQHGKAVEGTIVFYCPASKTADRVFTLAPDADGKQTIPLATLSKGTYTVKLDWKNSEVLYHTESSFSNL